MLLVRHVHGLHSSSFSPFLPKLQSQSCPCNHFNILSAMPRKHSAIEYNVEMLEEIGRRAAKVEEDKARERQELVRMTCQWLPRKQLTCKATLSHSAFLN